MSNSISRRTLILGGIGGAAGIVLGPALATNAGQSRERRALFDRLPVFGVPMPTAFSSSLEIDLGTQRRLLRFYQQAGANAVLAVASTGEMLSLSWPEALQLTGMASSVFGAARTWASISCGRSVEACVQGAVALRKAGASLPLVIPGLLANASVPEAEALKRLVAVGQRASGPLGLYEAISPFHRTLTPSSLNTLAALGTYQMLKTTQGQPEQIAALRAAAGASFTLLEANTAELAATLAAGASGVMDFCAACFPELLTFLCRHWRDGGQIQSIQRLCKWIGQTDAVLLQSLPFPLDVKAALAARGFEILPLSRLNINDLTNEQQAVIQDLVRQFQALCQELGIKTLI
ncbi:dihydrodipicolinate synthase family protein [Cyanobium sp. HWJ4-Hawea]|nr:dihydrodipicolinate synthase family protein [Cyanobium sp. HWJ4-Hawea]